MTPSQAGALALVVAACGSAGGPHDPWANAAGIDDETWGTACGQLNVARDSAGPPVVAVRAWSATPRDAVGPLTTCELERARSSRGELLALRVRVTWSAVDGTKMASNAAALRAIERLRALLIRELAPEHQPFAYVASLGRETHQGVHLIGHYRATGGFAADLGSWLLHVESMRQE